MKLKFILILIATVLSIQTSYSQKESLIGINFTGETTGESFELGSGISFERIITKHSGFETGIYYHSYSSNETSGSGNNRVNYTIRENYLSIPFLYKFYSSSVNVSSGPVLEYYLGYTQKNTKPGSVLYPYEKVGNKVNLGGTVRLGKSFSLPKRVVIEPDIRFSFFSNHIRGYLGFGIGAKYRLKKEKLPKSLL